MSHPSKNARAGLIITGIVGLFLAFDTAVKLLGLPHAVDATVQLGYPPGVFVWGALFLRDARLRALIPFTQA